MLMKEPIRIPGHNLRRNIGLILQRPFESKQHKLEQFITFPFQPHISRPKSRRSVNRPGPDEIRQQMVVKKRKDKNLKVLERKKL